LKEDRRNSGWGGNMTKFKLGLQLEIKTGTAEKRVEDI
jgi:hypothetical protein